MFIDSDDIVLLQTKEIVMQLTVLYFSTFPVSSITNR